MPVIPALRRLRQKGHQLNSTTRSPGNSTSGYISKRYLQTIFIAVLFTTAKWWKPQYPLIDEWVKKTWCAHVTGNLKRRNPIRQHNKEEA
jgi:hypothetical protein